MTHGTYVGKTCPYCQTPIKPGVPVAVCSACGMPHHAECWHENGRCTTFGCSGRPAGSDAGAAPVSVQRTRDGHAICPTCGYVMMPFDAACPRCENLRRQGQTPGPAAPSPAAQPYAQPYAPPGYGAVPPPPAAYPGGYGQPVTAECPYELRRWNWGAFAMPLFWAAAMNQWLWFALCFVPYVNWVVPFYLGAKGNELAWQSRQWADAGHFRRTQEVWNQWGVAVFVILIVCCGCLFFIGILGGLSGY